MACSICSDAKHASKECPKRKACGKCKEFTDHHTIECVKPYPPYDQQVCDHCLSKDHEAKNCKVEIGGWSGDHCKICGHGDHQQKKCPFLKPGQKKAIGVSEGLQEQFTPSARAKVKLATNSSSSKQPSSTPRIVPVPGTPPKGAASPKNSPVASSSSTKIYDAPSTQKKGGPRISEEQQKAWDEAEKKMPRPAAQKPNTTEDEKSANAIMANFFKIKLDPNVTLYRYSITLGDVSKNEPQGSQGKPRKLKRETKRYLVESLLENNPPAHDKWASDYDSSIISSEPLFPNFPNAPGDVDIDMDTPHHRTGKPGQEPLLVDSKIKYLGVIDLDSLHKHISGKNHEHKPDVELRALNIVSWKNISGPQFDGGRVGKKFYPEILVDRKEEEKKGQPFLIRSGFFSSMRPGESSILLNVNTTTSAFFAPINLNNWISKFMGSDTKIPSSRDFKILKNVQVTFDVHKESRKWVLCSISENSLKETKFVKTVGTATTSVRVYQYLKDKYKNVRFDPSARCVNVGSLKSPCWYPADKMTIVDWQVVQRVLPEPFAGAMVKKAEIFPERNKSLISGTALQFVGVGLGQSFYQDFGITATSTFLKLVPKQLKAPAVKFKGDTTRSPESGSWNLVGASFIAGASIEVLPIISLCGKVKESDTSELRIALQSYGVSKQVPIHLATTAEVPPRKFSKNEKEEKNAKDTEYREAFSKELSAAYKKMCNEMPGASPPVIMIVLEKRSIEQYAEVKRWADCVQGVPSVCITKDKFTMIAKSADLRANLALKFNIKVRGICHQLSTGAPKQTMFVGADCTHPGPDAKGCPSIAAVVATNDEVSGQFLASARLQKSRQEYISDLRSMMKERIQAWFMKAKPTVGKITTRERVPANIIFYRDGVSESQYGMVRHEELEQIKTACQEFMEERKKVRDWDSTFKWAPKITLIVVTKRHHARFYNSKPPENPKIPNLPAGTCVDTKVVTPNHLNFYLQSHHSQKGTARSSHYIILHNDEPKFNDLKTIQDITNNVCYIGARATKALSVCTPAQYADFLCTRLRCYMKPALEDRDYLLPNEEREKQDVSDRPKVEEKLERKPEDFAGDTAIWKNPHGHKNPWHNSLNTIMFYL